MPCRNEIPDLNALHETYKDKGFTVLGVSVDAEGKQVVAPHVRDNGVAYPVLLAAEGTPAGYAIRGYPTGYLIDRRGRVAKVYTSRIDRAEVARDVEAALASKP